MILKDLEVKHKVFGDGVVIAANGKYMTVKFASAEKIFVYPDAFESFLTLRDGSVPAEIQSNLAESREEKEKIESEKEEENINAMTHGIVIPGKEIQPEEKEEESSDNE